MLGTWYQQLFPPTIANSDLHIARFISWEERFESRKLRCHKIYHGILTRALDRWPAFYHRKWKYIRAPFSERINFRLSLLRACTSFLLVDSKDRPLEISFSLVRFQFPFRPRNFTTPLAPGITNQDRAHLVPSLHFYFSALSCFLFARRARNADGPARDSDFCEL